MVELVFPGWPVNTETLIEELKAAAPQPGLLHGFIISDRGRDGDGRIVKGLPRHIIVRLRLAPSGVEYAAIRLALIANAESSQNTE